jgi:molybdopterin molybdotransferase
MFACKKAMISVDEALGLIEQHARPLRSRRVPLGEAAELVLAEDVTSDINSPPYNKAMMDGYAVLSSDRQPVRPVIEEIAAGAVPHRAVTPGTAARIMTGAPLPDGADAVVPHEETELLDDGRVRFGPLDTPPGKNVLPLGASLQAGQVVLRDGVVLRPIEIAILAEIGHAVVRVRPRPQVAVLPTGNELVSVGERPAAGQIRNSNGPLLVAAVGRAGATAVDLGVGRDDRDDLRQRIRQGFAADVLLISGGVSAGKFDLVPEVLDELGVAEVFHKVDLRPGKPLWFGVKSEEKRRVLVFGLPGNPVSSFVCFELFVRPALAALAGRRFQNPGSVTARLSHSYQYGGGRESCLPARVSIASECLPRLAGRAADARLQELPTVEILPWHGSADLAALAQSNCLVRLSGEARSLEPGTKVDVLLV